MVYGAQCWKLCGDGHCCHFSRYRPPGDDAVQEFPLFDGEFEYMQRHDLLSQYQQFEPQLWHIELDIGDYEFTTLRIQANGACPCDHQRRTTVCRLYPLLPQFELGKGLCGIDSRFTIYEEAEVLGKLPRACQISQLSFADMEKFLRMAAAIYAAPRCLFSVMAYAIHKQHVVARLASDMVFSRRRVHHSLYALEQQGTLLDKDTLREELNALGKTFSEYFGADFTLS
jgi:hypothetical protein